MLPRIGCDDVDDLWVSNATSLSAPALGGQLVRPGCHQARAISRRTLHLCRCEGGHTMLNRLTVTALLTSVVAVMATCVVAFLASNAWDSVGRLQTANRISLIGEVSGS